MTSSVMSEGILLIASIMIAATLSGVVISKTGVLQSAFTVSTANQKDAMLTKIKIIYATNSSSTKVNTWIKNVGISPITNTDSVDVYFGEIGAMQRIPFNTTSTPKWNYNSTISVWNPMQTTQIDIYTASPLQEKTTYVMRIATPNGISDDYIFSLP